MDQQVAEDRTEVCHRCLQAVPPAAARCPHCGDPLKKAANVRLLLGLFGLLIFVGVAFMAIRLMMNTGGSQPSGDADQQQSTPEKQPALGQ
jgi:uncharacterized paraquat-inducible protein A